MTDSTKLKEFVNSKFAEVGGSHCVNYQQFIIIYSSFKKEHQLILDAVLLSSSTTSSNQNDDGLQEIEKWLSELRLSEYSSKFIDEGFDSLQYIATIDNEDLEEMGITKIAHRKRIINAAKLIKIGEKSPTITTNTAKTINSNQSFEENNNNNNNDDDNNNSADRGDISVNSSCSNPSAGPVLTEEDFSLFPLRDQFQFNHVKDLLERFVQKSHGKALFVDSVEVVHNPTLQKQFDEHVATLHKQNIALKFHGTNETAMLNICKEGFKLPEKFGMYGKGIYFATDSSKSAQYSQGTQKLLLCEVAIGTYWLQEKATPDLTFSQVQAHGYDSVYAPRGTKEKGGVNFDEFIIYHPNQALPKFVITYHEEQLSEYSLSTLLDRSATSVSPSQTSKNAESSAVQATTLTVVSSADSTPREILEAMVHHVHNESIQIAALTRLEVLAKAKQVDLEEVSDVADAVVDAMKRHNNYARLQELGCKVLFRLSHSPENKRKLERRGGPKQIVEAMKNNMKEATVQRWACAAMQDLTWANDGVKKQIVESGGIELILEAMKTHSSNNYVIQNACAVLWYIAYVEDYRIQIGKSGGIETIIKGMKAFKEIGDIQHNGCGALWKIVGSLPEHRELVCKAHGVEAIVDGMKAHPINPRVQRYAYAALQDISWAHDSNKKKIVACGGVELLVSGLQNHLGNPNVCQNACAVLWYLCYVEEHREYIGSSGAIEAIIKVMEAHLSAGDVQHNASGALWKIAASNTTNKLCIAKNKGIEALLLAMKTHEENEKVQRYVASALQEISWGVDENKQQIVKLGGVPRLVAAMKNHPSSRYVNQNSCAVLWYLAYLPANKDVIRERHAIPQIITCMNTFFDEPDVQHNGSGALGKIAYGNNENKQLIGSLGGIEAICAAMKKHANHANTQRYSCSALQDICWANDTNKRLVDSYGGIATVIACMKQHTDNRYVQQNACAVLWYLAYLDELQPKIVNLGGIEMIVRAMKLFSDIGDIQHNACGAIWKIVGTSVERKELSRTSGAIDAIIAAMSNHISNSSVQRYACAALQDISWAVDKNRQHIDLIGGIATVINALKVHKTDPNVVQNSCAVLWYLAYIKQNKAKIIQFGGIEAILTGMRLHANSSPLQQNAIGALFKIAENRTRLAASKINSQGARSLIRAAQNTHSTNASIIDYGDRLLALL